MWGLPEFKLAETARLSGWNVPGRLDEVDCPTPVITGEYDEISPDLDREMAEAIPDARLERFEAASHLPLWEKREEHASVVREFLTSIT